MLVGVGFDATVELHAAIALGEDRVVLTDADEFAGKLWESLSEDNKVSLFVRAITLETGDYEDVILNKYNTVEG